MTNRYKQAGVDVTAGYKLVDKIKGMVASTKRSGYIGNIGSFGGLFDLDSLDYQHPILVSGTDGVGTKLMIAQKMHKNDSIGIDCVAMCVNDVLAQGAEPLFFLDYIATGHNDPDELASVVAGVAKGCRQANVSLIGGETAEMPGMYDKDKYDLAGFTVGVGEKETLISSKDPKAGDILLGLASSGVHSNGFSLIRQILFQDNDYQLDDRPDIFNGQTLGENLLTPTKIYVKSVIKLFKPQLVHGISHITGGGLYENVPRMFGDDLQAIINVGTWPELAIFSFLKKVGNLSQDDLLHTFNMGIGMVLAIAPENLKEVETILHESGEATYQIGYLRERPEAEEKNLNTVRKIMNIAIFASCNGTNYQELAKHFMNKDIPGELSMLFCDHPDAIVIQRAKKFKTPIVTFTVKSCGNKQKYEEKILKVLQEYQIDFIILAGYLKIIGPTILDHYEGRIVNLHPAYLPEYPGLNAIERAFNDHVEATGVTVHYIDQGVDSGTIIKQVRVPILLDDTVDTLEARIHDCEHKLYPEVIKDILLRREHEKSIG